MVRDPRERKIPSCRCRNTDYDETCHHKLLRTLWGLLWWAPTWRTPASTTFSERTVRASKLTLIGRLSLPPKAVNTICAFSPTTRAWSFFVQNSTYSEASSRLGHSPWIFPLIAGGVFFGVLWIRKLHLVETVITWDRRCDHPLSKMSLLVPLDLL